MCLKKIDNYVFRPSIIFIFLQSPKKKNIVTCMKVTGEIFSFYPKRKGAEEVRYQKYPNFQAKGLLPDRTLESFILKGTEGAIPKFLGRPIQSLLKSIS